MSSFRFLYIIIAVALTAGCNSRGNAGQSIDQALLIKKEIKARMGLNESSKLLSAKLVEGFYKKRDFEAAWVMKDTATAWMDSMIQVIQSARAYGLFPNTYHLEDLTKDRESIKLDSLRSGIRKNPQALARMDELLTDAFLTMARHLHQGHLLIDSLSKEDADTYIQALGTAITSKNPRATLESFEPNSLGYREIKKALPGFLRTANFSKQYTHLEFPFRDSMAFIQSLIKRFQEEKYVADTTTQLDSINLSRAIKKVQTARGLTVDGKYGRQLISSLNSNDAEKFLKASINLDRYRMGTDTLPEKYLLVNLPAFELRVIDHDTIVLQSRVIIGKPKTPTPLLQSNMSQIIVYPTWTIPASILADEILPALKRDPGYLAKKGFNLYDASGNEVDPHSVNWSKYKKGIPYKIVQGEGIGNALGIMKFNFPNEHSVYLHDTNQRGLFQNENRSLSHGCVRVQNWTGLYRYIIQQDSIKATETQTSFTSSDSVSTWLKQKKRKVIAVKDPLPIFFRYYTAAGKNGKLEIYHDVYNMDDPIRKRILASQ